jgi:hypothetical protein
LFDALDAILDHQPNDQKRDQAGQQTREDDRQHQQQLNAHVRKLPVEPDLRRPSNDDTDARGGSAPDDHDLAPACLRLVVGEQRAQPGRELRRVAERNGGLEGGGHGVEAPTLTDVRSEDDENKERDLLPVEEVLGTLAGGRVFAPSRWWDDEQPWPTNDRRDEDTVTKEDLCQAVQAILDGPWMHATRALAACRMNDWRAFVRSTAPAVPLLMGRRGHHTCLELASSTFSGPRETVVELFPIWVCDAEEEASNDWFSAHAHSVSGTDLAIAEPGPRLEDADPQLEQHVMARVNVWDVGLFVMTRAYAPEIPMLARHGDFGVLEGRVLEVVDASALPGDDLSRPTLPVPAFCSWVEPRVGGLPKDVERKLQNLSTTVDDEGNLVPRSARRSER